jgi:myo-inositol-1(or 4)-monophosphatase
VPNPERLCLSVCSLVRKAGKELIKKRGHKALSYSVKGKNDFVTRFDRETEKLLAVGLKNIFPEAGFLGEENQANAEGREYNWIVDPIDGTTNFMHGVPLFSISVALYGGNRGVLGVIYDPNLDECFYSYGKGKAFLNKRKISVSKTKQLKDSLLATGFPQYDFSRKEEYMKMFFHLMEMCRGIRRPGSAAIDLAWVATGRFDGFWEYSLKPWDVAAGACIIQDAGGKVFDFSGGNNFLNNRQIIAGNPAIAGALLKKVKRFFS